MSVDRSEVLRIATLARLRLDEAELERMTENLNSILEHVDALGALEDEGAPGEDERWEGRPSTRAAEPTGAEPERLDPSVIAPSFRDGFFVVPPPPGVQAGEGEGS